MRAGHVPTSRIGPVVDELIRERWPHGGGYTILAEKVGCEQSTIEGLVEQVSPGMSFDLVDRILVGLGRWDMWHGVLADIYPTTFMETCANPVCARTFPERQIGPARRKKFCSKRCKDLEEKIRKGKATGVRRRGVCNRGHRLTPDNVWIKPHGARQCKQCSYERRNERMENPEYRAKVLKYHSDRHKIRKAAACN